MNRLPQNFFECTKYEQSDWDLLHNLLHYHFVLMSTLKAKTGGGASKGQEATLTSHDLESFRTYMYFFFCERIYSLLL